jgi:hypothetical protein
VKQGEEGEEETEDEENEQVEGQEEEERSDDMEEEVEGSKVEVIVEEDDDDDDISSVPAAVNFDKSTLLEQERPGKPQELLLSPNSVNSDKSTPFGEVTGKYVCGKTAVSSEKISLEEKTKGGEEETIERESESTWLLLFSETVSQQEIDERLVALNVDELELVSKVWAVRNNGKEILAFVF